MIQGNPGGELEGVYMGKIQHQSCRHGNPHTEPGNLSPGLILGVPVQVKSDGQSADQNGPGEIRRVADGIAAFPDGTDDDQGHEHTGQTDDDAGDLQDPRQGGTSLHEKVRTFDQKYKSYE